MTPQDALQTSCAGKGRFPTQQQAAERAKRMRQRHGNERPDTVYHCAFCGAWHIGGKRPVSADHVRRYKRRRAEMRDGKA